jgi:hypothetical protein
LRVEGAFQQTLETALILAFANPLFLFHRRPHSAIKGILRNSFEAALVIKISDRFKSQRKVYSWGGARRCTNCDNVIV